MKFFNTIESLATSASLRTGDIDQFIKEILSKSADSIGCERVNAWIFDEKDLVLNNLLAFDKVKNEFSKESTLHSKDLPNYFKFLKKNEIIVADDARSEPMNEELVESYLKPNDIFSMIDVPVRSEGNMIGVICFEFTRNFHNWTKEEEHFTQSIAQLLSLCLESDAKKKYRESLEDLVNQKDILLKEINHRVKNNISIIYSLINMQQRKVKNTDDSILFEDLKNKVFSMAAVQEQLHNGKNIDRIEVREYLIELIRNLKNSFDPEDQVKIKLDIESINLDITKAIPLGLISNEVITNSFKYALMKIESPMLFVQCKNNDKGIQVLFKDNGPGKGNNPGYGLGMEIIESLTDQLDGSFKQYDDNGLISELLFS